jgi:hypothetical protein
LPFFFPTSKRISRLARPHPASRPCISCNKRPAASRCARTSKTPAEAEAAPEQVIGFDLLERDPKPESTGGERSERGRGAGAGARAADSDNGQAASSKCRDQTQKQSPTL